MKDETITIELSIPEAAAFRIFQQRYDVIAPICGYLDSLKIMDLTLTEINLNIDQNGLVKVMKISKTFR